MEAIDLNEYLPKIIASLIPFIIKGLMGKDTESNNLKKLVTFIYYTLPIATVIWINLDEAIKNNKLTTTLIALNFAFLIFTYWQQKLISHYELITKFTNIETDKVQQINNINNVQVEKVKAINDNQKYILDELSRINDRFINFIANK